MHTWRVLAVATEHPGTQATSDGIAAAWLAGMKKVSPWAHESAVFRVDQPDGISKFYFAPGTKSLAEAVGAVPCMKPPRDGLTIFAGEPDAFDKLFEDEPEGSPINIESVRPPAH